MCTSKLAKPIDTPFFHPKGSDSVDYVVFSHPQSVKHLVIDQDPNRKLSKFRFLETLVCNEIKKIHLTDLDKFVRREIGQLTELHCNLAKLTSPSYQPDAENLVHLKLLFRTFERYRFPRDLRTFQNDARMRVYVDLYLQGVKVKFEKPFEHYRFGEKLLEVHHHNFTINRLTLTTCPSIWQVDYLPKVPYALFADGDFPNLYPNIQCVYLFRSATNETISPEDYFLFVEVCLGLRELRIYAAGFDELFYVELSKLDSVQTLSEFYLVEMVGYAERFEFDFLQNFKHLRLFGTNLATRRVMIKLVERLQSHTSSDFQFAKPTENFFCECIVEKREAGQLEVLIGQRDSADSSDNAKASSIRVIMDCQNAADYFNSGALGPFSHWLDHLP